MNTWSIGFRYFYDFLNAALDARYWITRPRKKKDQRGHSHSLVPLYTEEQAPTINGGITAFTVMRCGSCPHVAFFPSGNLQLVTDEYRTAMVDALIRKGYKPAMP